MVNIRVLMILPQFTNTARIMAFPLCLQVSLLVVLGFGSSYFFGALGMVVALGIAELSTIGVVSLRRIIPQMGVSPSRFLALSGGLSLTIFAVSFVASFVARRFVRPLTFLELGFSVGIWVIFVSPFMGFFYRWVRRYRWS